MRGKIVNIPVGTMIDMNKKVNLKEGKWKLPKWRHKERR